VELKKIYDMNKDNEMYVKINEYYTATVRSLRMFKLHLDRKDELFDEYFGDITYVNSDTNPRFVNAVIKLINNKRAELHKEHLAKVQAKNQIVDKKPTQSQEVVQQPKSKIYPKWRDWNSMTDKERKEEFKLYWNKDITTDVKRQISRDRIKTVKKEYEDFRLGKNPYYTKDYLLSHRGDGYVILDDKGERIDDLFDANYVTRKGVFEAYSYARKIGLKEFEIAFVTSYLYWDSIEDKFNGVYPENAGTGESYNLLQYTPNK
jgi:hypothetical protein